MKKKILLPTDYSENAWNAIVYAMELYKDKKVDFYLLNAFSTFNYSIDDWLAPKPGESLYEEAKKESFLKMSKLLKQIKQDYKNKNHDFYTCFEYSSPLEAVKKLVEIKDIELVILGSKGASNNLDTVAGSNAISIMEKVRNCPVLMIPPHVTFKLPNEIVFPTSFKTHYKRRELQHLYEISKITNAPIRILHVENEAELSKSQIANRELLEECFYGLTFSHHSIKNSDIKTALHLFVQSRDSEMIVFINKKHAFFNSILTKPMVKDLGHNSEVPVLALHDLRN